MWLLLISCHNNKLFLFTELANIVVVIVTNPMFILSWVHEKFTVKFTMSNVDGHTIICITVLRTSVALGSINTEGLTPKSCRSKSKNAVSVII